MRASTSDRLRGMSDDRSPVPVVAGGDVCGVVAGAVACGVSAGFSAGLSGPADVNRSTGGVRCVEGSRSSEIVGAAEVDRSVCFAGSCDCDDAAGGKSTLPKMMGMPSLLLPITTIFELGDCASCRVASMPRQRR